MPLIVPATASFSSIRVQLIVIVYTALFPVPVTETTTVPRVISKKSPFIGYLYPFICQKNGFYPAYVINDHYARLELTYLTFMLREIKDVGFENFGSCEYYTFRENLKSNFLQSANVSQNIDPNTLRTKTLIKLLVKRFTPKPLLRLYGKIRRKK